MGVSENRDTPKFQHRWFRMENPIKMDIIWGENPLFLETPVYMSVSENSGTQIIHFNKVFHYKLSILGYPYFWKRPYTPLRSCLNFSFSLTFPRNLDLSGSTLSCQQVELLVGSTPDPETSDLNWEMLKRFPLEKIVHEVWVWFISLGGGGF